MTWGYYDTGDGFEVYDHTGSLVDTISYPVVVPDDVLAVMNAEVEARGWDFTDSYVTETMKDLLGHDVDELEARP